MKKDKKGNWFVFNRDYAPLGWSKKDHTQDEFYSSFPVQVSFGRLTNKSLEAIFQVSNIYRDDNGDIETVYFYNDESNPLNSEDWNTYFEKLRRLSNLKSE